ncbi:MAG: glycosyltransferase, partial [Thermoanaerobaculia bacterium]
MTVESLPASVEVADSAGYVPEVSVIVPVLNEAGSVVELSKRVAEVLDRIGRRFEILFVDDGSSDETRQRVKEAHEIDIRVKLVSLRRNFGKAAALCAGFDHSHGEILITMDGDLQDDPDEIPHFLEKLES